MDVPELSLPIAQQLDQLRIADALVHRIITNARVLLGSNKFLDVVTYRVASSQDPDYVAELIEHTGPHQAVSISFARAAGTRNTALWLLLDMVERECELTMCGARQGKVFATRRLGGERCAGGCAGRADGGADAN